MECSGVPLSEEFENMWVLRKYLLPPLVGFLPQEMSGRVLPRLLGQAFAYTNVGHLGFLPQEIPVGSCQVCYGRSLQIQIWVNVLTGCQICVANGASA